ncbi:MAG: hypothetical protein L3J98_12540 [Gammaproteobacteria bacterium]|nr:hypothetical protein [Gammaproteobacteria bacterium]
MSILPHFVILTLAIIALLLYPWFVNVSFLLAIVLVPSFILLLYGIFQTLFMDKQIDFIEIFTAGSLYSLAGIPIYFILVIPVYLALLKVTQFPIIFTFPFSLTIIMLLLFVFLTTKSWGYIEVLVITGCSVLHSFFILWLISKLKPLSS